MSSQENRSGIESRALPQAECRGTRYRITVLTGRLLRLEYNAAGIFEDRPTQVVLDRRFEPAAFTAVRKEGFLTLTTDKLRLVYAEEQPFSGHTLWIELSERVGCNDNVWRFGDMPDTLDGTARTLDGADGAVPLSASIMSRRGFSFLDDSRSLVWRTATELTARPAECADGYFFGYGHHYKLALRDFYHLTGPVPLLPRWALGNWWSRYHRYSADEYQALITRFEEEKLPFSVAILDMDWHLTEQVPERFGNGWTGFSWNRELFPDPPAFLDWLHKHHLKTALNLHPADGLRPYEEAYGPLARALGLDATDEQPIAFDPADPRFMAAYFRFVLHPLEAQGVDFWWVDWQQGELCRMPGLDPLWVLNRSHYLDNGRAGKRALTFSRYAGIGSHRYPIGFSGDTIVSWKSLAFQPYFSAAAANVGYGWWSHDIGGHMHGTKDDELAVRWLQFGVFSPIMRLHSTDNPFNRKEPWHFGREAGEIMKYFLRLRHRLLPYLFSMNYLAAAGCPIMRPLYYEYPENEESYDFPNVYFFGTELLAAPITEKMDRELRRGKSDVWLPAGDWTDVFSGVRYPGGVRRTFWRPLATLPVLAKAGAIIPIQPENEQGVALPECLEIHVFPGADNAFTLYEEPEDGDCAASRMVRTHLVWREHERCMTLSPPEGETAVLPRGRRYVFCFHVADTACEGIRLSIRTAGSAACPFQDFALSYEEKTHTLRIALPSLPPDAELALTVPADGLYRLNAVRGPIYRLLDEAQMDYDLKLAVYRCLDLKRAEALTALNAMALRRELFSALCEYLLLPEEG